MTVPSFPFLGFCLAVVVLFRIWRGDGWRQAVLLGANLVFLASFSTSLVAFAPFAIFIALGFVALRWLQAGAPRRALAVVLVIALVGFMWLKRYSLLPQASFLPFPYVTIGLSYIFFRILHLLIEAREGGLPARLGVVSYLNYTLNFTCVVSGPIQLYGDYHRFEQAPERLTWVAAGAAGERIVVGLFKVMVLSLALSHLHQFALAGVHAADPLARRVLFGALVAVVYPLFLYANFSGYTDVVIGVARGYGLTLPENFNRPFSAQNFIDFWTRWHITLSNWLKAYVFNPLIIALMRRFPSPEAAPFLGVLAFFVTFFLIGLWHGQTSIFVVYGVLLGLGISLNKLYQVEMARRIGRKPYRALAANRLYAAACRGLTFAFFSFSLFFFWSNWGQLGGLATALGGAGIALTAGATVLGASIVLEAWETGRRLVLAAAGPVVLSRYTRTVWCTALVVVILVVNLLMQSAAPEIVYKSF